MNGKPGQLIVVESESVGTPDREGEILEVIQGEVGIRYRVRWVDGHESVFTPSGGAAKILPAPAKRTAAERTPAPAKRTAAKRAPAKTTGRAKATGKKKR